LPVLAVILSPAGPNPQGGAILFEGARLIAGDGKGPIETSAFLVGDRQFTKIGRKGSIRLPAGATRIS
jgi:hypothetical protein